MSDLTFYTHPMSRGRIIRWMLEEVGAPYDTRIIGFGSDMKAGEYTAINPMGKVPAIKHGKVVVTECAAICAYLADAFPEKGLAPPTGDRGLYYRWLFFAAGPLEMGITNRALGLIIPEDKYRMAGCGRFEYAVTQNPFIAGDSFTAADVYVGSHIVWGQQFGSLEKRQPFSDYLGRLGQRPAFLRAQEIDDAVIREMQPA